jgi:DNA invertase Pin-like site-specific DNA recombinase
MANVLATFAQFERRLIGRRTREALEAKRASGVRLGRPVSLTVAIRERIASEQKPDSRLRRSPTRSTPSESQQLRAGGSGGCPRRARRCTPLNRRRCHDGAAAPS